MALYRFFTMSSLLLAMLARPAVAQLLDPVHLLVGAGLSHDSNVFRLPESVDPASVGRPGRSDTLRSAFIGMRFDKAYSLQRVQLDVTHTAYRYDDFEELDFDALNYRGAWLWRVTPRVSGTLSADHAEAAVPFDDFQGTRRNTRTTDNRGFTVDGAIIRGWHLLLGGSTSAQRSSIPIAAFADFDTARAEAGIKLVSRAGNSVAVVQRLNKGEYLNEDLLGALGIAGDFRERQNELAISWTASGRSSFNARFARLDRHHPDTPDRDFKGSAGSLGYLWLPSGKVQLRLAAQRDLFASLDAAVSRTQRDTLSLGAAWEVSAKLVFRGQFGQIRTEYLPTQAGASARRDDTGFLEGGIEWRATRGLTVAASLRDERRSSSDPGLDYQAVVSRISGSLTF